MILTTVHVHIGAAIASTSIHPKPRKAKAVARKRANHLRNRALRAVLNREYKGEIRNQARADEYHTKLKALSLGTV